MENLESFMKTNILSKEEESKLDNLVLREVRKKPNVMNVFYKLAVTVCMLLFIGVGMYFLPEEQRRKVVKPVSAQEVLEQTYNKIQSLIKQPGILHYEYVVVTEHEDIESYDNFEIEVYVSTENNKYKSSYVKTRSEGELVDRGLGDGSFQQFPRDEVVIFNDGKNEYIFNDYTENYRNLTPEMINIEHNGYLSGLASFYEFLLENDNGQYTLTEKLIEGKQAYVITFDYKGAVMDVLQKGIDYDLLEKTYQAEIIIDKESLLPILNRTNVKDESFVDTQYEKFTKFELLESKEDESIFDFKEYMRNARTSENPTVYSDFDYNKEITGEVRQNNPGEDIIEVAFYDGPNKYNIEGNLLQDRIISKPTIIGKFLSGKTTTIKGFSTKTGYGNVFWIQSIDYSKTRDTNSWITTTPIITVKPTDSVLDVKQSIDKIYGALALFEKTKTVNYKVSGTDGDETRFTHEYDYDIEGDVMKVSANVNSLYGPSAGESEYVYYRKGGKYYLDGEFNKPLTAEELYIAIHDVLWLSEGEKDLLEGSNYAVSGSYKREQYREEEVEIIKLKYKTNYAARGIFKPFVVSAEVTPEEYSVEAIIDKDGRLLELTIPYHYGEITYSFQSYNADLNISIPVIE